MSSRLGLLHEVADRLDAGALQAVVGADAELELLDQDVVQPVGAGAAGAVGSAGAAPAASRRPGRARQLLDAVGVGEDRQAT